MKIETWLNGQIPLSVVCLLKRGGPYDFNYVKILSQGIRRHLLRPHRFICLTDADLLHRDWYRAHRIQCRPLIHDWPADWAKMELFRPGLLNGRVLYFDLDVMVTGSLFALGGYDGCFAMAGGAGRPSQYQTSLMAWHANQLDVLYRRFAADPDGAMEGAMSCAHWLSLTAQEAGSAPDRVDDLFPNLMLDIVSVPGGAPRRASQPGAGLMTFRNGPKPHQLADQSEFIRDHWV